MKALIKVGYACNQLCAFCHRLELRGLDGTRERIHSRIERAKELGHTMVVLSGGEPTIRPELMEWASHVASLDMDLGLVTNGQMLAYPELLSRLRRHRLEYVHLSLHGGTAEVHDRVVRAAGFERTRTALDNLSGLGLEVVVNTVVTAENLDHLLPIVDLLLGHPDMVYKLSMIEPRGGGERDFDDLVPRVSKAATRVREALAYGLERRGDAAGPRFAHDGFPLCLLPGFEGLYDDLYTSGFATMVEVDEPDFCPVDARGRIHPACCTDCAQRGACPGLFGLYFERRGDRELAPILDRPRSNSFHYTFERMVAEGETDSCPLLEIGVQPWARERTLFVHDQRGVSLHRTRTRDFADAEIEAIKLDLGQVYLDVSRKPSLDDFPEDLIALDRSRWCEACPEQPHCTGMFVPVARNAFAGDDQRVRDLLGSLSGDVIDIGCGDGRYEEILAPLAADGRIRYLGIEPAPTAAERLARRWPWAEVRTMTAEAVDELAPARFDWALILRSWNHLREPERAVAAIVARLRPGGTLLIADSVALALVRSRDQSRRAEGSAAGFEHFRNHSAQEVDVLVGRFGVDLVERRDVGPATSAQWLLVYRVPL